MAVTRAEKPATSQFDAVGAFNQYYNTTKPNSSLSLPLDVGSSIPKSNLSEFYDDTLKVVGKGLTKIPGVKGFIEDAEKPGFWKSVFDGMEAAYNLAAQTVSFGLVASDENSPLFKGGFDASKVKETWEAAGDISPGQALTYQLPNVMGYGVVGKIADIFSNISKETADGKLTGADKFIQDHVLYASNKFNIFDAQQRRDAFEQQVVGQVNSFTVDVLARFFIDPTIIGGKALKVYRAGAYSVKGTKELDEILSGAKTGYRASRVKTTFNDFLVKTDGMTESDLFRVKAIRESSNPAMFADLLAQANKIEDVTLRHATKADMIHMAMGDATAATRLRETSEALAARIGALQSEVSGAKYFGAGLDKSTGNFTFDLLNNGVDYEKSVALLAESQDQLDNIHRSLMAESIIDPNIVPSINAGALARIKMNRSQSFIDLRSGVTSLPVRVLTGFAYKRPKNWIDFTDNGSVQTVDNLLSRVRGITQAQTDFFVSKIQVVVRQISDIESGKVVVEGGKDTLKKLKKEAEELKKDLNLSLFTVERKNELFAKYTSAIDPADRANVYDEIEKELFDTVARQFGYSTEDVAAAYSLFSAGRSKVKNIIQERAYTGAKNPDGTPTGSIAKPILGSEGLNYIIPAPLNETQLVKQLPVIDIDTMYKALSRHTAAGRFDKFGKVYQGRTAATAKNIGGDLIDGLDSLIKLEVLGRLGYPVRNVTEGFMRILATVGPMAIISGLTQASRNIITNRSWWRSASIDDIFKWSDETKLGTHRATLHAIRDTADDPVAIDAQIAEIDKMIAGEIPVKDKFGLGLREVDGVTYEDAMGATPDQFKAIRDRFVANSAKIVDSHFREANGKFNRDLTATGDFVVINGSDANWGDAYLRVVNRQVRGSQITKRLLAGESVEEVESFLLNTKEGRNIMRLLAMGRDARGIVEANLDNINHLFPDWANPELRAIAAKRQLTAEDVNKYLGKDSTRYPDVNAAQVGAANGTSPFVRAYSGFLETFYKYLGEIPESYLVRHPLFVDLYRKRVEASIRQAIDTYPDELIPPAHLKSLESNARQWARQEMRRTLYDTSERVDAAYMLKYVFPFFGAYADVAEKWGRIAIKDPSVIRKLETVYDSPDRLGMVEERDGITYINLPGEWTSRLDVKRPMSIPKPSLNLIFQGGAWWNPGAGWFVQFGASQILTKVNPDLETTWIAQEVLPYGPTGTGWKDLAIQSAGLRKIMAALNENDQQRANLTVLIAVEENFKYDNGLRETIPTAKEINERVVKTLAFEAATRFTLPFATNLKSPYQFYIDQFQQMRQEDPLNAADNFYEKWGDEFYIFTTSRSKNNTGIGATIEADKRAEKLKDLIALEPEYGWFIVGDTGAAEFSPTVYKKQQQMAVAPGSTTKFRSKQDPYEAIKATNAEKGWLEYNKGMDLIEAQRINRGLKSLQSRGAEDLLELKKEFVANLENENPDWSAVRGKIDTNKINNFLKFSQKLVADPRVSGREDIQGMSDYLVGREYVIGLLAQRPSQSLDNQANADIRELWNNFTGQVIDEYPLFNKIYTRVLENDDLRKGL